MTYHIEPWLTLREHIIFICRWPFKCHFGVNLRVKNVSGKLRGSKTFECEIHGPNLGSPPRAQIMELKLDWNNGRKEAPRTPLIKNLRFLINKKGSSFKKWSRSHSSFFESLGILNWMILNISCNNSRNIHVSLIKS